MYNYVYKEVDDESARFKYLERGSIMKFEELSSIPEFSGWSKIELIDKGWSSDKKYYIETINGERQLLRVSKIECYDAKVKEFEVMKKLGKLNINMSKPISFGTFNEDKNTYLLLSWVDGLSIGDVINSYPKREQYLIGVEAGKILKKFHSIENSNENNGTYVRNKFNRHLDSYKQCGIKVNNDECAINFMKENIELINNRNETFQHGDFHIGNLVIDNNGVIGVIDFNRWKYGDPYEEFFKSFVFSRECSVDFAVGQINGYFNCEIPKNFFDIVALYLADTILYSVAWAIPFGEEEVKGMLNRAKMVLEDLNYFNNTIPNWYSRYRLPIENVR